MTDRWKSERVIESAVDKVFEYAKKPANPYSYLYHNPRAIQTPQYFAHWTQKWQNHKGCMILVRAAKITGHEPVPAELLHRNVNRDGWSGRGVQVGRLLFYLIKPDEMPPGLKRRYYKFKDILFQDIKKDIRDYYDQKEQEKAEKDISELFG